MTVRERGLPQWKIIYNEVKRHSRGEIITYDRMNELLDRDSRAQRHPIERAARELERVDHCTLICVRGKGYRIAQPGEHVGLAERHTVRSQRQLGRASRKIESADREQLSPEQAARLDAIQAQLAKHEEWIGDLNARDARRARELRALRRQTSGDVAHISDQFDQMKEALRRHGIPIDVSGEPAGDVLA
ncbi:hypothetical protein [Spongiactinospora gelatinilytica]|nr:hypothetical protein [Spongiactinospora gelatinilytica]